MTDDIKNKEPDTITMDTGDLKQLDSKLPVTIRFDDLNGSATFQSIGYDAKADTPVILTTLYDNCNVVAGIVEPNVRVTISVNGESIVVTSDRWGFFVTDELPICYEGDEVSFRYYDKAGNTVRITKIVGEPEDPVLMDAFMLGKPGPMRIR